jgi:hypothetical protein
MGIGKKVTKEYYPCERTRKKCGFGKTVTEK